MAAQGYRPWLDGIRTFSILLVLIEHGGLAGIPDWNFGGTGVGIFFVLSGYLISGLLLDEIGTSGTIQLRRFYLRRAARLMPALVVLVIVGDMLFVAFGMYKEVLASVLSLFYVTNYATVAHGKYLPGFGHTWSLAVEEHFYLLWPLVLLWLTKRLTPRKTLWATFAICLLVLVWRLVILQLGAPARLMYVGSLERSDTLLYGALAAMAVRQGWQPRPIYFYLGVALISWQLVYHHQYEIIRPLVLALGATLMISTLDHCPLDRIRRVLSTPLVVWLGVISYGIYLWHGTLFHLFRAQGMHGMAYFPVVSGLSIGAAALSHRYIEMPIRDWARARLQAPGERLAPPVIAMVAVGPDSLSMKD